MEPQHFTYQSNDKVTDIHAVKWVPDGKVKAVLQISHGMTEYIERYHDFAVFLNKKGILVVGNDHLGHGDSVRSEKYYGYFAKDNGNRAVIKDMHRLRVLTQKEYPDVPYFILGHSMGSFLVRQYLCFYGEGLSGAVIMGTGYYSKAETWLGMCLAHAMAKVKGWDYRSNFVDKQAFGGYNRKFGDGAGKDWLSRNEENVAAYISDKRCSFKFTLNAYYNMFYGIHMLSYRKYLDRMPKTLPVFFVAGNDDPVGNFGVGVLKVYEQFGQIGMENVTCKLYPDDRHEILNEVDKLEVYENISDWIMSNI